MQLRNCVTAQLRWQGRSPARSHRQIITAPANRWLYNSFPTHLFHEWGNIGKTRF